MMPKQWLLLVFSAASLILSGCAASLPATLGGDCYNKALPTLLDATDLKVLFQDIASELCVSNCSDCGTPGKQDTIETQTCGSNETTPQSTVMVTDFADIQSFLPNQSGLLMGELMRGGLNQVCNYKIIQAEFAKYFKLSENGLIVLTRQAREIKRSDYSQPDVIVGTYSHVNINKVMIFVRKINTETGTISKMVTRELNYTCGARSVMGYGVK